MEFTRHTRIIRPVYCMRTTTVLAVSVWLLPALEGRLKLVSRDEWLVDGLYHHVPTVEALRGYEAVHTHLWVWQGCGKGVVIRNTVRVNPVTSTFMRFGNTLTSSQALAPPPSDIIP